MTIMLQQTALYTYHQCNICHLNIKPHDDTMTNDLTL